MCMPVFCVCACVYVYACFALMHACVPCISPKLSESEGDVGSPRNWNYRWFWAVMWVLGTEPRSSLRAVNILTTELFFQPLDTRMSTCTPEDLRGPLPKLKVTCQLLLSLGLTSAAEFKWSPATSICSVHTEGGTAKLRALCKLCPPRHEEAMPSLAQPCPWCFLLGMGAKKLMFSLTQLEVPSMQMNSVGWNGDPFRMCPNGILNSHSF
jgi:hypothetical protein